MTTKRIQDFKVKYKTCLKIKKQQQNETQSTKLSPFIISTVINNIFLGRIAV